MNTKDELERSEPPAGLATRFQRAAHAALSRLESWFEDVEVDLVDLNPAPKTQEGSAARDRARPEPRLTAVPPAETAERRAG